MRPPHQRRCKSVDHVVLMNKRKVQQLEQEVVVMTEKKKTKKKNEDTIPSPSRKMVKKMKRKGNTSVPYGSGYKKVNEVQKLSLIHI
mgnify:CR=1 FL=1